MPNCKRCGKSFRDNYLLTRHLSRLNPCSNDTKSESLDCRCKYCLKTYFNNSSLKRHYGTCKHKNDPIRLLEIELNIETQFPDNSCECRFCSNQFPSVFLLSEHVDDCKYRKEYYQYLIDLKNRNKIITNNTTNNNNSNNQTIINNTTNNNNTNSNNITNNNSNNIFILSFGNENLDGISPDDILADINKLVCENSDAKNYVIAGKLLTCFEERIKQNPQNKNTKLRSVNSDYGTIKTDKGNKKVKFERFIDTCIKNTAQNLNKKKPFIKTKDRETKDILKEVNTYAEYGFEKPDGSDSEYSDTDSENILDYKYVLINES
jgi:hypothetical protein